LSVSDIFWNDGKLKKDITGAVKKNTKKAPTVTTDGRTFNAEHSHK